MTGFLRLSVWTQVMLVAIVPTVFLVASMGGLDVISVGKRTLQIEQVLARHPEAADSARAILERTRGAPRAIPVVVSSCLLAVAALAALVARSIARRLELLTRAAERMASGDLDQPVATKGSSELDELARALDAMRLELGSLLEQRAHNAAREQALALTASLQQMALPEPQVQVGPLSLRAECWPAAQASGDWWWHEMRSDGSLLVLLGDVTGHGTAAALVTAAVAASFRALRDQHVDADIPSLLATLSGLLRDTCADVHTMTMCAVLVEPARESLTLFSAGAPPVFVRDAGGVVSPVHAAGTPLGAAEFKVGCAGGAFAAGSTLLVFSDGVSELPLQDGRELGMRRLRKLFAEHPRAPELSRALSALSANAEPTDDRTFVLVAHGANSAANAA